ncbi:MAG: cytochrome [Symbiobacteriaceae bacterium]|jgi:cytochrome bd-type quinol oxidase subunit 1|nr:cytochrome [Symbiobacteriaceae bacterium]
MSYPLWEVPYLGGGLLIAIVAIVHVFISQFAVGGGLFLALATRKAYQNRDTQWLDYLRHHSRFFVLASVLFGAVTGVGIWFTIGLIHAGATSSLIRIFVWGWAIEWCFFLIETSAILLYYYGWDRVDARFHQLLAWVYCGASFLTLAVINGIVSFMLTPGAWLENGSFWSGVFNPGYLPQLVMRTGASLALAGIYGLVTATWRAHPNLKERLVHWCSKFVLTAFALFPVGAIWLLCVVSPLSRELALGAAAPVAIMNGMTMILSVIILGAAYFGPFRRPAQTSVTFAMVMLALALLTTGGAEWVREGIRKPFIIYDYMYSNGVYADQQKDPKGIMATAVWSVYGAVDKAPTQVAAGEDVFRLQCAECHTVQGYNGVTPLVKGWTQAFASDQIDRLNMLKGYMPPFMGTPAERDALAAYLVQLNAKEAEIYAAAQR